MSISIVPPRLSQAIEAVVNRDKTIDARPGPDYERLYAQAIIESKEMERSVQAVHDEFKDLVFEKVKENDQRYVRQLISTGPNTARVFVGKQHGDTLFTGRAYEMVENDINYSVYGTFNADRSGTHEIFHAHGICRVDFEYLKKTHHVDHRFLKLDNNKPENQRLEYSVLDDGSKQLQWLIGNTPSANHPTFFISPKGVIRVCRQKSPDLYKVFCVRTSKDIDSLEVYYVDKENALEQRYEQIKYDSLGRYFHRIQGHGTCVLGANLRYEGKIGPKFEMTGQGKMTIISPRKAISGEYKDGKITHGIIEAENWKYEGDIKDGVANGKGKKVYDDKDWAEGDFKNGVQVGVGRFHSNCCQSLYVGEFKDGQKSGKGIETFQSGDKYEGQFKDGQFSGLGKMTFTNGDSYEGEFDRGVFHGIGRLVTEDVTIETKWTHGKLGEHNEDHIRICCSGHHSPVSRKTKIN